MSFEFQNLEDAGIVLIDGDRGKNYPKQSDFSEKGHCLFLSAKNVTKDGFKFDDLSFISSDKDGQLRAGKLQKQDIILTTRGTIGNVAFLGDEVPYKHIRINSGMIIVRANQDRWNNRFLYYLMTSRSFQDQILSLTSGSAVPQLPARDLKKFALPIVPLEVQDSAERIISSLSNKIRNNSSLTHLLEQIAQAIFKSWFVDFEPTKAKIAAREALLAEKPDAPPEQIATAEQQAAIQVIAGAGDVISAEQLQNIADLFPNQLVESELGEIPDGWEVSEIGNEVKVCGGGTPSTKNAEFWDKGNIAWTTPKDLSGKTSKILIDTDRKITELGLKKISSGLLPVNTVLLSSRAPVGYLALAKIPLAVNQGYIAMVCDKNITPEFVINWCDSVMDEIKQRASGTTFSEISKKNFKLIKITLPPKTLCEVYSLITEPLYNLISSNETESEMLKNIRDSILPKLLNGEIGSSLMEMSGE